MSYIQPQETDEKPKPIILEIENISFIGYEILESFPDMVTLNEFGIEYKWKSQAKIKEDGVEKERKFQGNRTLLKTKIAGIQALWDEEKQCFAMTVFTESSEITTVHKTFAEALKLKETIINWLEN